MRANRSAFRSITRPAFGGYVRRGSGNVALAYDGIESQQGVGVSPYRLTNTYTGPLYEVTAFTVSGTPEGTLQVYDSDAQVAAFLAGRRGDVTKVWDQFSGELMTGTALMRIAKSQGRWAFVWRGGALKAPAVALPKFNGVTGIATVLIASNAAQQQSGEAFTSRVFAGTSTSNTRHMARTKTPLGFGLVGRKVDGSTPATESNSSASNATGGQMLYKPSMRIIAMLDYARGYLRIYDDGNANPTHARDTYYTAGGTSSATDPSSTDFTAANGMAIHEYVLTRTNLVDNDALAKVSAHLAGFFGTNKLVEQIEASYTYQNGPMLYRAGNYAVAGSVSSQGRVVLTELDRATGEIVAANQVGSTNQQDDHAPANFCLTPSGVAFTCWAGHNQAGRVSFGRGTTARISTIVSTGTVNTIGTTAYANCFTVAGKVCILTRNLYTSPTWVWELLVSSDDGVTFPVSWRIAGCPDQFYLVPCVISANVVRLFAFKNSDATGNAIKVADLDVSTGVLTANGQQIADFTAAPTVQSDYDTQWATIHLPATYQTAGQDRIAFWTGHESGEALIFGIYTSTGANGELYYSKLTNAAAPHVPGSWTTSKVCNIFPPAGSIMVPGRANLVHSARATPRIYVATATDAAGGTQQIQQWDASNANGTAWSQTRVLDTIATANDNKAWKPVTIKNSDGTGIEVMWNYGYQKEYYEYDNRLKFSAAA